MNSAVVGTGIRFPYQIDSFTGSTQESGDLDRIRGSIFQILQTRPGERFMRPDFGCKIASLVFEPNLPVLKALLTHHVTESIGKWEKRVALQQVTVNQPIDSPHRIDIYVEFLVLNTQQIGNLVYPFYREVVA